MERRKFLTASLAASALSLVGKGDAQARAGQAREFYQLRRYQLQMGPQTAQAEGFIAEALVPTLTRLGMGPIGAFKLEFGLETPDYYVLIPSKSVEALAMLELDLVRDEEFLKVGQAFWSAPATTPAFLRMETSLLAAFEGWPKLMPPAASATKGKRIFQLRTYESPSERDHVRKVEMFNAGEFEVFKNAGCNPVFFGDTLIGSRMPSLTYMLSFQDATALDAGWNLFRNDPAWKKLSSDPKYAYESIVSNISNLILSPLSSSQI